MSRKKTHEEYVSEVSIKSPTVEVIEQYIDARTPILHRCMIDGHKWQAAPTNVLRGHGCPMCAGNIQKTHKQYVDEVSNVNPYIEVIDVYVGALTPIKHKCRIDGHEWVPVPSSILRGEGCPVCGKKRSLMKRTKTHAQYVSDCEYVDSNIEVIDSYINCETPILHRCKIDNHIWLAKPNNILSGYGCPLCAKNIKLTHQEYVALLHKRNPTIDVVDTYVNMRTPITHRCLQHGVCWKTTPERALNGCGCPKCRQSSGERAVSFWLDNHSFEYVSQYKFDDCNDVLPLPFDFYLPQANICIEYDGGQHFVPVDWGGEGIEIAQKRLALIQSHDEIKNRYCNDHNIRLLRIPYFANIEEELEKFLFI